LHEMGEFAELISKIRAPQIEGAWPAVRLRRAERP
jgi:hypothetical protein